MIDLGIFSFYQGYIRKILTRQWAPVQDVKLRGHAEYKFKYYLGMTLPTILAETNNLYDGSSLIS